MTLNVGLDSTSLFFIPITQSRFPPTPASHAERPPLPAPILLMARANEHDNIVEMLRQGHFLAETARIFHKTSNLHKNRAGAFILLPAWGPGHKYTHGGEEHAARLLNHDHGMVNHLRGKRWNIHPRNAVLRGLLWPAEAIPPDMYHYIEEKKTRRRVARKHFSSRRKSECELSGKCVVRSVKSSELR